MDVHHNWPCRDECTDMLVILYGITILCSSQSVSEFSQLLHESSLVIKALLYPRFSYKSRTGEALEAVLNEIQKSLNDGSLLRRLTPHLNVQSDGFAGNYRPNLMEHCQLISSHFFCETGVCCTYELCCIRQHKNGELRALFREGRLAPCNVDSRLSTLIRRVEHI